MASSNTAWGIEIGQYAIKAIQLESHGSGVRVRDFAVIKHEFVLTDPALIVDGQQGAGADRASSIIEMSLNQLATQKKLDGKNVMPSEKIDAQQRLQVAARARARATRDM